MTLLKRFLDFYINSSLHVALAVLSFSVLTSYELHLNSPLILYSAVFFASVVGYNFVKYFGLTNFYYRSLTTKLKYIQLVSALSLGGLGYAFLYLQHTSQILFVFLGLITFFYAIPMGVKTPKNLRSIGGIKIYVIAFVWTMTTVVLPVFESQQVLVYDHWILGVQRTFVVIVLMLPFEIRDLDSDQIHLSTIPQKIGIRNTKIIGFAILGDTLLLEFFKDKFVQSRFLIVLFLVTLLLAFLVKSTRTRNRYYTAFWVESVPILTLVLLWGVMLIQKA
ncbi:hypothetical protein N8008_04215 [Flavobacteriaceae bacterium]|jgi:hypothetical protein|nr:hypothetical protein [Flavobacteriaceae bacterium]MDG1384241.1 hypothetical protein [Flavobacteriaceae bacterium]